MGSQRVSNRLNKLEYSMHNRELIPLDDRVEGFLRHLAIDRAVSPYTIRNYRQAFCDFRDWHLTTHGVPPRWLELGRDDFRFYLRALGRRNLSRSAIQIRFSALRALY